MKTEDYNGEEMHKRRETMADNRRYIIYYTFGDQAKAPRQAASATEADASAIEPTNADSGTSDAEKI